jgi:RND family efflux transporter MFP subunit
MDRFRRDGKETPQQSTSIERNVKQYRDALRNLGMSEIQIEEIARTRQYAENIQIRSPTAGFVIVLNVSMGLRFDKGTELYRIADLSRVWILADLFENEASYFKPGRTVKVTLREQKKTFTAKVSAVLPQFDPATRTLKLRLEVENPGYTLRPDMFVDVSIPVTFPPAVIVPADAVLDAGIKKTVFVDRGNGIFEPRLVETGWRFGNRVEIKSGLKPGERIVVSGNFLIDSESKMELAAAGMYGTLEKDPVCGADIAVRKAEKAGRISIYQGKTYYFSSLECKQQFDKNPNRYLEKPVKEND